MKHKLNEELTLFEFSFASKIDLTPEQFRCVISSLPDLSFLANTKVTIRGAIDESLLNQCGHGHQK